jgi:hypothetical protein
MPLVRPLAVSLLATGLVVLTFTALPLWGSVGVARAFATREEFTSGFSLHLLAINALLATQLALPLGLWHARQVLSDERLALPLITILRFAGILLAGRIVPWVRYGAPIAPLACGIACALLFSRHSLSRTWQFVLLALVVTGNVAFIAVNYYY